MAESSLQGERPSMKGFRRSSSAFATIPTRSLSVHEKAALDTSDAAAELLYSHPTARIFNFSPPTDSLKNAKAADIPQDTDYPVDAIETLPWRSRTETLVASNGMVIEKVRGSTNFLKASDIMHAMMRNTQCWCVDGESKFVLRIRKFVYYRIELPTATEEDRQKVEELRRVMTKIARFERTPCPFIRAFHVDLPDDAITPRRKGTWKARVSSGPPIPETSSPPLRRVKNPRSWSQKGTPPSSFPSHTFEQRSPVTPSSASSLLVARTRQLEERSASPASFSSDDVNDSDRQGTDSDGLDEEHGEGNHLLEVKKEVVHAANGTPGTTRPESVKEQQEYASDHSSPHTDDPPSSVPSVVPAARAEAAQDIEVESHPHAKLHDVIDVSESEPTNDDQVKEDQLLDTKLAEEEGRSQLGNGKLTNDEVQQQQTTQPSSGNVAHQTDISTLAEVQDVDEEPEPALEHPFVSIEEHPISTHVMQAPESLEIEISEESAVVDTETSVEIDQAEQMKGIEPEKADSDVVEKHIATENNLAPEQSLDIEETDEIENDDDTRSTISTDSFHTIVSAYPQSPRKQIADFDRYDKTSSAERVDPVLSQRHRHRREPSETTVTTSSLDGNGSPFNESQPSFEPMQNDVVTTSSPNPSAFNSSQREAQASSTEVETEDSELRRRLRSRRSFSPLPPSSTIVRSSASDESSHMTKAIFQKAAVVAVVKPLQVIIYIAHVLMRIAGGATVNDLINGELFRNPNLVPEHNGIERSISRASENEDDYGVPLRGRMRGFFTEPPLESLTRVRSNETVDEDTASFISVD